MTTITIVTTLLIVVVVVVVVVLVDATAIKNCCNVAVGDHYFSINKNQPSSISDSLTIFLYCSSLSTQVNDGVYS